MGIDLQRDTLTKEDSTSCALQVSNSRRTSTDKQSEGGAASTSNSSSASPTCLRAKDSDGNVLLGREVLMDDATEFKCRSSGTNRYHCEQLICCTVNQTDMRGHHQPRYYIFEVLIGVKERSHIWDQVKFWEDAFLDAVARERDLHGLDHAPATMLQRYSRLSTPERRLWELKEDRILATLLHNLIAFMVMMSKSKQAIYNIGYLLLGRCRLGSHFSYKISNLLECIAELSGNAVDLIPPMSDGIYREAFIVTVDLEKNAPSILEIYDRSYLLRGLSGAIEVIKSLSNIVAVVTFPKEKICIFLENIADEVIVTQMHCRKLKTLVYAIQVAMGRISFQAKRISNPVQFCVKMAKNPDHLQQNMNLFGAAEGTAFSKLKDIDE